MKIEEHETTTGNAAAMRKALSDACYAMFNFLKAQNGGYEEMSNALDKAKAALAAPPRNCDVGTPEVQEARFRQFCNRWNGGVCLGCKVPVVQCECALSWAQMPYEAVEEGAK